jgi:6-phosphogluconolactonase
MDIQVCSDLEVLSHKAAAIFVDISRNCIVSKGRFIVAIPGGFTPRRLYALLSSHSYRKKVDWRYVYFFWTDERCVPKEYEDSNFRVAFETLLSKLQIPDENIYRIKGEEEPEKAAREYEDDLREFFGKAALPVFDLIILGVGEDGHTASLFPGLRSPEGTGKLAVPVFMEKPKRHRVTLTFPVLNNSAHILFLVAGPSKADIVYKVLEEKDERERYPAGLINPVRGTLTWLIDKEAARRLKKTQIVSVR